MGNNNFWEDVGTTFATTMLSGIENTMAAKKKQKRIDTMLSKIDPTGKNRYAKGLSKSGDIEYGFLDPNQQVQRDNLLKLSKILIINYSMIQKLVKPTMILRIIYFLKRKQLI